MRRLRLMASLTTPAGAPGPIDAHHVGTQVAQDHRGMWARPDASELDNSQSAERSSAMTHRPFVCSDALTRSGSNNRPFASSQSPRMAAQPVA